MRRISRRRFDAKMPLKIGEPRCRETGECSDSIGRQEVPIPCLPRSAQPFITRQAEFQQRYERWRKNEEPHDLAVARDECMTLQEQFTNGERASNDLAEEHSTTAAVEHCVYGVIGGAIGAKAQRWRAIDWINRGPRPEGATGNNRRCERRCDRNM